MRTLPIFLVLVSLPLAGGVNYLRNAPLDEELQQRPYAGVSDADLAALLGAYGAEVERTRSVVDAEPGAHVFNDPGSFGHQDAKAEAFEKFQHSNEEWKHARGQLFGQQTELQALQHESSIRERGLHRPASRIWRRISSL